MIVYRYNQQTAPPAAMVRVTLAAPHSGQSILAPALVDSGADRTIVPESLMKELGLPHDTMRMYQGFAGEAVWRPTFTVLLGIHDLEPIILEVAADPDEAIVILGRDVLNQHRIVLDGPNQRLEIG